MIADDFALICFSRHRSDTVRAQSGRFFPEATYCVAQEERNDYRPCTRRPLLLHPNSVTGIGPIRQWILDNVRSRWVVLVPDDVVGCYSLTGTYACRLTDPALILGLLRNTAECAEAAGAKFFGFNQAWDVRKYSPFQPFNLNGWFDGPTGIGTREIRYDPALKLHPDIDYSLQQLLKFRLIWQDNRFSFSHDRWKQAGGNAVHRSEAAHKEEFAYLQRKWGAHLSVRWAKGTFLSKMNVERRQHGV
mgnify:CR=1 FL=1